MLYLESIVFFTKFSYESNVRHRKERIYTGRLTDDFLNRIELKNSEIKNIEKSIFE